MYREGPDFLQFSQHAPFSGCEPVIRVSFSTAYEFFRAMEIAGMYQETEESLMRWANLIELDCTCCLEEPENGRSECHAWSALSKVNRRGISGSGTGRYFHHK
ncbi:hypothetical protein [Lacrimispora sp. 38-1]|uniref:hypothetical protein n=1 Tax=Lacrimispora sp. 38-1 TaxID=3125778 RepID=UPI003CFAE3C6